MRQNLTFLFVAILILVVPQNAKAQPKFKVGDAFPNLPLPSLHAGVTESIGNYSGQKLILHIFASW